MKRLKRTLTMLAATTLAAAAQAHEGHGLPGTHHWHAEDALALLALAAVAVAVGVVWYIRRK